MDDIYRNLSALNYWGQGTKAAAPFAVTELWQSNTSGDVSVVHRTIAHDDAESWLAEQTAAGTGDQAKTLVQRLVWADVDVKDRELKLSDSIIKILVKAFGLKLAYGYARSCLSGATAFPPKIEGPGSDTRAYCFCYTPKIACVWSHTRRLNESGSVSSLTQGIMFVQSEEKKSLQRGLEAQWTADIYRDPLFPVFCIAILLGAQIDGTTAKIKTLLRSVEKRTGYHNFASRHEKPAEEELSELSAQTSGSAAKLASTLRKAKTLEKLLTFTKSMLKEGSVHKKSGDAAGDEAAEKTIAAGAYGRSLLDNHVSVLQNRQEMQVMDTEYTLQRVQVQIDALFSIIQQKDAVHNLELSEATHEIAYFSYRDSSSMKTLAVVTMFFLPGSFISALFSTQCFDWDSVDLRAGSIGVKPTPQFNLYWAITIPLTLMTFFFYFLWLWFQKRERDRKFHSDGEHAKDKPAQQNQNQNQRSLTPKSMEEAEGRLLARRRRETMLEKTRATFSSVHS